MATALTISQLASLVVLTVVFGLLVWAIRTQDEDVSSTPAYESAPAHAAELGFALAV